MLLFVYRVKNCMIPSEEFYVIVRILSEELYVIVRIPSEELYDTE